jgi:hypothetical protein
MIGKTLTSVALIAGCAVALALPMAQAQTVDTQILMNAPRVNAGDRADWMAGRNNAESAQYDRRLDLNRAYRQSRILKECGPITNAHLRAGCIDSFDTSEDQPSPGWNEGLTGGGTGMMNSVGPTPYSPNMPIPDAGR